MIHGSGGGFDQGELFAQTVLSNRFHAITPSRFGYLRSTFHAGATYDDQAAAYAYLLDQLGVQKVAVVAFSAGGASALIFAVSYPERVSSLTLVSTGVVAGSTAVAQQADDQGRMLANIVKYDFPYWFFIRAFNKQFMGLMGANDAVIASLSPEQQKTAEQLIDYMNPAALRAAGAAFDHDAGLPGPRIAAVQARTLIIHATDDTLQPYYNAAFAAATIPGAKLLSFERGGHLLAIVEQPTVSAAVQKHITDNLVGPVIMGQ